MRSTTGHHASVVLAGFAALCALVLSACNPLPVPPTPGADTAVPAITSFTITSANPTGQREISVALAGTDNVAVTGWMIKETAEDPDDGDSGWLAAAPTAYTLSEGYGVKRLYAWARDAAGNVSVKATVMASYKNTASVKRVLIWGAGPDGVTGTADDVMQGYLKTSESATEILQVNCTGKGPDGLWFTADDVIPGSYSKLSKLSDGSFAISMYSGPGPDGILFTDDDVRISSPVRFKQFGDNESASLMIARSIWQYSAAGPDGQWFTDDDVVYSYSWLQLDDVGDPQYMWSATNRGTDGIWGSADDVISGCSRLGLDSLGRVTSLISYSSAGPDGNWTTTADNKVSQENSFTYSSAGWMEQQIGRSAGYDGILGTADDYRSAVRTNFAPDGTIISVNGSSNPGADGLWFTADDTVMFYWTYQY